MEEKETKIIYHVDDEETPYLVKLPIAPDKVTLADFKNVFNRPNYKFFFKSMDDDFGVVKEEIMEDDAHLPCFNGRVVSWLVSAEGSNVSDGGASQCTDSVARIADHGAPDDLSVNTIDNLAPDSIPRSPRPNNDDLMSTETESLASSKPAVHHMPKERMRPPVDRYEKYHKYNGLGVNGHSKHRNMGLGYDTSSMMSSELETTSFLESDDDASSRITTTTGRASNLLLDGHGRRRAPRRKRHRQATAMSRTSSFSSITDSSMSLNIITVTLNMDTVNFLGISIVGQSNNGGDGGIYVGSIMKGGAVALDGRIEPGDMILQVNDINFENMSNDEAVRVLREVVQKPGAIKLVVAKCWDPNPKGYFTIPRTEPVRPIDPGAWVAHTAAMRGETYPLRPPSVSTLTSTSSSLISSIAETEIAADTIDNVSLTVNTDMAIIVKAMAKPNSGLEIRDRLWLKITIPNAFIGADVVDWLETHVEGFTERREARRYASQLLKAGYIRHCVNKSSFSEQCYYIFGEAFSVTAAMSRLKLEEPERDNLPHPGSTWDMPYSGTYLPHSSPMPFNYTNDTTCYSLTRDGSGSGGSRSGSDIMGPNMPLMKTAASGASSSGGGGTSTNVSKNDPNGKQRAMIGSSGSETSSNPAYSQDLSASQQSFKMAMDSNKRLSCSVACIPSSISVRDVLLSPYPPSPALSIPSRNKNIDHDMEALRLSRQDDPFLKVLASRESLADSCVADAELDGGAGMSQVLLADVDPLTIPEFHKHMVRSPPPVNWPRSPVFRFENSSQESLGRGQIKSHHYSRESMLESASSGFVSPNLSIPKRGPRSSSADGKERRSNSTFSLIPPSSYRSLSEVQVRRFHAKSCEENQHLVTSPQI